jgi:hypothetical protein
MNKLDYDELTEDIVCSDGRVIPAKTPVYKDGKIVFEKVQMPVTLPDGSQAKELVGGVELPSFMEVEVPKMKPTRLPYYKPKKYPKPNLEINVLSPIEDWNAVLETGKGSIRTAPVMSIDAANVITITGLPKTKTVDHVRKIVEKEILLDKIDIRDETTETIRIVIEKVPHKQCDMKELFKRLYTKLQSSETYNLAFFDEEKIYVPCSFHKVIRTNLQYVIDTHRNRLVKEMVQLNIRLRVLQIIEDMKKKNSLKSLFDLDNKAALSHICTTYKCDEDIASKVLQKPISYLTKEHGQELVDLMEAIDENVANQSDIYEFMTKKYKALKKELTPVLKNKFAPTTFIK